MTNTALLKQRIAESGMKKGKLAEKLHLSMDSFGRKVNNKREFKASEIQALCTVLNIESLEEKEQIFFAQ